MAPPLIDTSIVPEVPVVLYALFDYGLTDFSPFGLIATNMFSPLLSLFVTFYIQNFTIDLSGEIILYYILSENMVKYNQ